MMMNWNNTSPMESGDLFATTLVVAVIWVFVVVASVLVFRGTTGWKSQTPPLQPLEILNERFARGEMNSEEYKTRRCAMRG